ncbi:MAG TPA: anti-sigma regulatory factor [Burkholderiaceae bacterium]|nr:anti-sigma regulatory factor [Burkholderiaceae bacterium]
MKPHDNGPLAIRHESDLSAARLRIRAAAQACGLPPVRTEALATAVTEIARNMLMHASGGEMVVFRVKRGGPPGIEAVLRDAGPGIPDIDTAMRDGFSTGNSLGLGLSGARRLVDEFEIDSEASRGTTVVLRQFCEGPPTPTTTLGG